VTGRKAMLGDIATLTGGKGISEEGDRPELSLGETADVGPVGRRARIV